MNPPRNKVVLIPAGNGVKKRQAIIKMSSGGEIVLTRQRKDGQTVGFKSYNMNFKTLNTEDLMTALLFVTKTDDELRAMQEAADD